MKFNLIFKASILLLLSVNLLAVERNTTIFNPKITPYSITIIGEQHGHPESIQFFQSLIKGYLKNNKCLTVALEISSNQQTVIDQIVKGRAAASELNISSIIDQPALRKMIDDIGYQKRNGVCLDLLAIDTNKLNTSRDEWMGVQLKKYYQKNPVLVLLGGLHSLKKVNWDLSMTKGGRYVAEILNEQGINVRTYPQIWVDSECGNSQKLNYKFVPSQNKEALNFLNSYFISILNAYDFSNASEAVDGVILWECTNHLD